MSTAHEPRVKMGQGGFQRWVKLSTDDLPLIRPPKHHMLAHITGGLTSLYDIVKRTKKEEPESEKSLDSSTSDAQNKKDETESTQNNGHTDNNDECSENLNNIEKCIEENNTEKDLQNDSKDGEGDNTDQKEEDSQNEKKDDEGGGEEENISKKDTDSKKNDNGEEEEEEEETTPYTDEEGEFSPEKDMPPLAGRYKYTQILGRGQSAIIIKVLDTFHKDRPLAIKVLHRVYKPIGSQEADILLELQRADPWLHVPFARLLNQFLYGPHYCLVFEYLSPTPLYTHYDQRDIREVTALPHIRDLTVKLLTVLGFLYKQNVIHADLKPENILLKNEEDLSSLMVVDFGNALRNTDEELSLYYSDFELQTLLYRAPEVIFGMKFSLEVDMWSLGCLLAECYLGEPLFMGKSKKEILNKITGLLGPFPREFNDGEYAEEFADFIGRPLSRYQRVENLRKRLNDCKDSTFLMLIERLLTYLPDRRFTPFEAACHPFVACSTPFLYLTPSPGYIRYPTILLDMSTYPYLPGLPDDDDDDSASAHGRKRLASFSKHKRPNPSQGQGNLKDKDQGAINSGGNSGPGSNPGSKTATRSDVKETLKSMGLRCEDFTISVYSKEQAHAILRRQGVEVTANNVPSREKFATANAKGFRNTKSFEVPKSVSNMRTVSAANRLNAGAQFQREQKEDDDDDCVILDPPEMPRPVQRFPQQFQLMGTTVQVNRGAKRPNRPLVNQPQAKRSNARPMQYYRQEHNEEYSSEASVQDTLKRLKNYNISITCRRNASGMRPQGGPMDSESDMDNDSHMDSDDEEDMTKYLECQIGEIDEPPPPHEELFDEDIDIDCDDKDDVDYNPRGKKKSKKSKTPRKNKKAPADAGSTGKVSSLDSSVEEIPEINTDAPLEDLDDQQMSSQPDEEEKDPLAEENDDQRELREILENAANIEEEQTSDNPIEGTEENTEETNAEDQEGKMEESVDEDVGDPVEENIKDPIEENVEEENKGEDNILGEFVSTGEEISPQPKGTGGEDEEEIDEELEKELLCGDIPEGEEGEMEEDL